MSLAKVALPLGKCHGDAHVHARSSVGQRLRPVPMTRLMAFLLRFLLILVPERARGIT